MISQKLRGWSLTASRALLLLALGCGTPDPDQAQIPDDVLPMDSMVAVLTDIHIVEGAKVGRKIIGDTLKVPDYYSKVFLKHGITQEYFEESFRAYSSNPAKMQKVYEEVIENLNKIDLTPQRERFDEDPGKKEDAVDSTVVE